MRPQVLLLSAASLTLLAPSANAARIDLHHNDHNSPTSRIFPILTWLRDGAIEFVFGPAPARSTARPASHKGKASLRTKYNDQVVLRFNLTIPEEETVFSEAATRLFLDVWAFNHDYVDIRIRNADIASLLGLLPSSLRSSYSTLIPDLAASVYDTYPAVAAPPRNQRLDDRRTSVQLSRHEGDNVFFQEYQPLSVIVPWMRLMEAMFPSITEMISIGQSFEGRDIPALKVGVKTPETPGGKRKTVVVTGGMHAREWISTTTANYVAWSFITSFGKEPMITKLLEHFDFVFVPAVNPDGIEYTWQVDRLWRKSRQQTGMQWCRGFDLDHAFGFEWSGLDSENDPCSESYGGTEPWEATEAIALAKWAKSQSQEKAEFVGLIDLHSYSQQILFPFAYSCDVDPPNVENLEELATGLAKAIRLSNGEQYSVTSACEGAVASQGGDSNVRRIETGGGSAIDWFYHELHAHYSYQIKLRDTGSYGFLLPKENIVPVGEEIFNAMKYFGDYLLGNNGIEKSTEFLRPADQDADRGVELRRMRRRR